MAWATPAKGKVRSRGVRVEDYFGARLLRVVRGDGERGWREKNGERTLDPLQELFPKLARSRKTTPNIQRDQLAPTHDHRDPCSIYHKVLERKPPPHKNHAMLRRAGAARADHSPRRRHPQYHHQRRRRCATSAAAFPNAPSKVVVRPATSADLEAARRLVLAERLNPLGLDAARTLVAVAGDGGGSYLGSGQLSPLQRAPWQQQQQQQQGGGPAFELRSLVVVPESRGKGVGSALVAALLELATKQVEAAAAGGGGGGGGVFLTTTAGRAPFYARAGFEEVELSRVPPLLQAEVAIGTFVAAVVAKDRLVVMERRV